MYTNIYAIPTVSVLSLGLAPIVLASTSRVPITTCSSAGMIDRAPLVRSSYTGTYYM